MDDTECPLLSLPPELHVLILGNLEVDEICRMSMVCRTFRECCDDELWTLWQDIYKGRYGGPVAVSAFGLWKTRTVKAFKEELRVRNESGAPFVAEWAAKHGHTMVLQQLSEEEATDSAEQILFPGALLTLAVSKNRTETVCWLLDTFRGAFGEAGLQDRFESAIRLGCPDVAALLLREGAQITRHLLTTVEYVGREDVLAAACLEACGTDDFRSLVSSDGPPRVHIMLPHPPVGLDLL